MCENKEYPDSADSYYENRGLYWGIFLDLNPQNVSLERPIEHPHITFGYKTEPGDVKWGEDVSVKVIGYGNDNKNEALKVELDDDMWGVYQGAETPHITLSVSKKGKPVNSANLDFEEVLYPYYLEI